MRGGSEGEVRERLRVRGVGVAVTWIWAAV